VIPTAIWISLISQIKKRGYAQSPSKIRSPRKQHRDRNRNRDQNRNRFSSGLCLGWTRYHIDTDTVSMPISISISISSWGKPQLGLCA
jgi:phosphopantetheinyl transferase